MMTQEYYHMHEVFFNLRNILEATLPKDKWEALCQQTKFEDKIDEASDLELVDTMSLLAVCTVQQLMDMVDKSQLHEQVRRGHDYGWVSGTYENLMYRLTHPRKEHLTVCKVESANETSQPVKTYKSFFEKFKIRTAANQ